MSFFAHLWSIPEHLVALIYGETRRHLHLRNRLLVIMCLTIVVDLIASYFVWKAERRVLVQPPGGANFGIDPNWAHIKSYWDSIFFTTTQLLTVSSLMNNPYSDGGRIIDMLLELYGITVATFLAGAFGAFFVVGHMDYVAGDDDDDDDDNGDDKTDEKKPDSPAPVPAA
jgi:hypothetical protein